MWSTSMVGRRGISVVLGVGLDLDGMYNGIPSRLVDCGYSS